MNIAMDGGTSTVSKGPFLSMYGGWVEQAEPEPAGTILVGYHHRYRKLTWSSDGGVEISEDMSGPRIPLPSLNVPREVITQPSFYQHELYALFSRVRAKPPQDLHDISERIASLALSLAADLPSSLGYSITAELEFLELDTNELFFAFEPEEDVDPMPLSTADLPSSSGLTMADLGFLEVDEDEDEDDELLFDVLGFSDEENVDLPLATGTSKRAIEKLISKGRFVVDTSDQDQALDRCGICLEDISSPYGPDLPRMDCSRL